MGERTGGDGFAVNPTLIAHCRGGFEPECGADLARIAMRAGATLVPETVQGRAVVVASTAHFDPRRWAAALAADPAVFARSIFVGSGPHALSKRDRVAPLLASARAFGPPFQSLWLETTDTNEGKRLSGLCKRLEPLLAHAASNAGLLTPGDARRPRLHVLFTEVQTAYVGSSDAGSASAWPMGIPRLKMPRDAPSRSILKLVEALVTFLLDAECLQALRPGMRAVDLGAAPGGWTWELARRGLRVTAVDNGPLKGEIARDPLVGHLRVDGFNYWPRRPVEWMVCDIVDKPSRVATLVAAWIADGACRRCIFNLKLPMKKRYDEVQRCAAMIRDTLDLRRLRYTLRLKQLYHDREEVTGYCARTS